MAKVYTGIFNERGWNYFEEEFNHVFNSDDSFAFLAQCKEWLQNAPGGLTEDTGVAYPGGLLHHIVIQLFYAKKLRDLIKNDIDIPIESVIKVCILMHLSKAEMFVPNDNDWELKKGKLYKFAELEGKLKFGDRSILMCMNNGIRLTPSEFEAMKCLDNSNDDNLQKLFSSPLSTIIRIANELSYMVERARVAK